MNLWVGAATALLLGLVPCAVLAFRGDLIDALIGVVMGGVLVTLALMLLAEGFHRAPLFELPVVLVVLSFAGGLVFARNLERWL